MVYLSEVLQLPDRMFLSNKSLNESKINEKNGRAFTRWLIIQAYFSHFLQELRQQKGGSSGKTAPWTGYRLQNDSGLYPHGYKYMKSCKYRIWTFTRKEETGVDLVGRVLSHLSLLVVPLLQITDYTFDLRWGEKFIQTNIDWIDLFVLPVICLHLCTWHAPFNKRRLKVVLKFFYWFSFIPIQLLMLPIP